jgi:hypothetical protein
LGSPVFGRPYITGSQLISFPPGTQMFPSPGFAFLAEHRDALRQSPWIGLYSGISGSKIACVSPELIAAYRALRRHPKPSHSPYSVVVSDDFNIPGGCLREPYAWQHRGGRSRKRRPYPTSPSYAIHHGTVHYCRLGFAFVLHYSANQSPDMI